MPMSFKSGDQSLLFLPPPSRQKKEAQTYKLLVDSTIENLATKRLFVVAKKSL